MSPGTCACNGAFPKSVDLKIRTRSPSAVVVIVLDFNEPPLPVLALLISTGALGATLSSSTIGPCASTGALKFQVGVLSFAAIVCQYSDCRVVAVESSRINCQPSGAVIVIF